MHVITTHKWGYVSTMEWCHKQPNCTFHEAFPRFPRNMRYRADVVVARNVYEAVASGYTYHRRGGECWVNENFEPNPYPRGGNDFKMVEYA